MPENRTVQVELVFDCLMDGQPTGRLHKSVVDLPVPEEALKEGGRLRWPLNVALQEVCERQDNVTVRHVPSSFPVGLVMDTDGIRALLDSDEPGRAEIRVPLSTSIDEGKEVIRDADDRIQGVVERTFVTVSLAGGAQESA